MACQSKYYQRSPKSAIIIEDGLSLAFRRRETRYAIDLIHDIIFLSGKDVSGMFQMKQYGGLWKQSAIFLWGCWGLVVFQSTGWLSFHENVMSYGGVGWYFDLMGVGLNIMGCGGKSAIKVPSKTPIIFFLEQPSLLSFVSIFRILK